MGLNTPLFPVQLGTCGGDSFIESIRLILWFRACKSAQTKALQVLA